MTRWKHFVITFGGSDETPRALGRTDEDGPRWNCQTLNGSAEWVDSDFLVAYHLHGTTDKDYAFVEPERAEEIIAAWVSSGRLPHPPDET
jgi:hypothetical protein